MTMYRIGKTHQLLGLIYKLAHISHSGGVTDSVSQGSEVYLGILY